MTVPVVLHGTLASHRRGRVLQEALAAEAASVLPEGRAVVMAFGESFQGADRAEQARLVEWTRASGHVLLLLPPFAPGVCEVPVTWRAERLQGAARGGEGLASLLSTEVTYRIDGKLQTLPMPGAMWSDLSVCLGINRLHPAAGLFAVTSLPLWSLTALDAADEVARWLDALSAFAGESRPSAPALKRSLTPDHFGMLVFLMSRSFMDEGEALAALQSSSIFRLHPARSRQLLTELRDLGHVDGATPTTEAAELVMKSPYACYVSALREVPTT
jgi:hypothetical protein